MILGIGTDIVDIARVRKLIEDRGDSFAARILTGFELSEFLSGNFPERYLAKKFAAKEAVAKAFGTGIGKDVGFKGIEIYHDDKGKPSVRLLGSAKEYADKIGVNSTHLSISDEKEYVIAYAVLEG